MLDKLELDDLELDDELDDLELDDELDDSSGVYDKAEKIDDFFLDPELLSKECGISSLLELELELDLDLAPEKKEENIDLELFLLFAGSKSSGNVSVNVLTKLLLVDI